MRPLILRRPPPSLAERLIGRRRARLLRRRAGFAAVGLGLSMLRPRPGERTRLAALVAATMLLAAVATLVTVQLIRPA